MVILGGGAVFNGIGVVDIYVASIGEILSPWCDCRFCSSWQMVEDAGTPLPSRLSSLPLSPTPSISLTLALSLSLSSHLKADHAQHEAGPVQDL